MIWQLAVSLVTGDCWQDAAGAAGAPGGISGSSRHAESLNEGLSTSGREDANDKDVSRKDKVRRRVPRSGEASQQCVVPRFLPTVVIPLDLFFSIPANSTWRSFTCRSGPSRRWSWPSSLSTRIETSTRMSTKKFSAKLCRRWVQGEARLASAPLSNGFRSSTRSSRSPGVPQQERRDQPGEGGQPGQGLRGQIQTRQETQERRRLRQDAGRSVRGHRTRWQPVTRRTFIGPADSPVTRRTFTCPSVVCLFSFVLFFSPSGSELKRDLNTKNCFQLRDGTLLYPTRNLLPTLNLKVDFVGADWWETPPGVCRVGLFFFSFFFFFWCCAAERSV